MPAEGPSGRLRWRLYAARENRFLFSGDSEPDSSPSVDAGEELERMAQENILNPDRGMLVQDGDEFRIEVFDDGGTMISEDHYYFRIGVYGSLEHA